MRLVSFAQWLVLAAWWVGFGVAPGIADPSRPEPIATRQSTFIIPFQIDKAARPEEEPAEIQLSVSTDRGSHWVLYQKVKPDAEQFAFRADRDGEYWFMIHTLDRAGRLRPDRIDGPGLRVVVDTGLPKLRLDARQEATGRVIARWEVNEEHLDPDSLKIEFRTSAALPWKPVPIDRGGIDASKSTIAGEVCWFPPATAAKVEVRAEAADTAGNQVVAHELVELRRGPSAGSHRHVDTVQENANWRPGPTGQPATQWQTPVDLPTSTPWQTGQSTGPAPPYGPSPSETQPPVQPAPWQESPNDQANEGSVAIQIHPAIGNRYTPSSVQPSAMGLDLLPPGQRPRMVSSRLFEMDYQVESVGPSGVGRVELWGTQDGGRTWQSFGIDDDKQSPLLVSAENEGIYGFSITVQNGAGIGGEPPQTGDTPDLWIGVDLTKPSLRIVSAEQETTGEGLHLLIDWEAEDLMLSERPVSLFFSELRSGPWTPIAVDLENTGRYRWALDDRVPERIYLRLEAHDAAGNLGIHELPAAISLDRHRPTVHIRNIRPVGQSSRTPPRFDRRYVR